MPSLKDQTRSLLLASDLSDKDVAVILGCSAQWVTLFRTGRIKAPNVDIIQKLYEHLTGEPLLKA